MFESVEYQTEDGVATVRLARPDMRNALDERLLRELVTALKRVETAENVYAVVLSGEGAAFSAGGDLNALNRWQDTNQKSFKAELGRFQAVIKQLRSMGTPSVAAVNGPAIGAGCDIALACDIRVVSPEAELSEGFVSVGLLSGDGGAWLLPHLVGEAKAKEYLLTGKTMSANEAVDIGLAAVKADDAESRAQTFAERLRDLPREAVRRTKELTTMTSETLGEHLDRATEAQWACLQDPECADVLNARIDGCNFDLNRPS